MTGPKFLASRFIFLPSAPIDRRFRAGSKKASPGGEAASSKRQASSLTAGPGDDRIDLERNNYE